MIPISGPSEHCFILGAGFSCGYTDRAPTMKNFLKSAKTSQHYQPNTAHKDLAQIIASYFEGYKTTNIEVLATFLTTESSLYDAKENRDIAYSQLLDVVSNTLRDIYAYPKSEEISKRYSQYADFIAAKGFTIVTLNYDLLMDQLLKKTGRWAPFNGYGVTLPIVGYADQHKSDGLSLWERMTQPNSMILKLHGSLNWGVRDVPYENGTHPIEMSSIGAFPPDDSLLGNMDRLSSGSDRIRHKWKTYIVPPVGLKNDYYRNATLQNIWHAARYRIAICSHLHILGYSLPAGDFSIDNLLRESLHSPTARSIKKTVHFVNRNSELEGCARKYAFNNVSFDFVQSDVCDYIAQFV